MAGDLGAPHIDAVSDRTTREPATRRTTTVFASSRQIESPDSSLLSRVPSDRPRSALSDNVVKTISKQIPYKFFIESRGNQWENLRNRGIFPIFRSPNGVTMIFRKNAWCSVVCPHKILRVSIEYPWIYQSMSLAKNRKIS